MKKIEFLVYFILVLFIVTSCNDKSNYDEDLVLTLLNKEIICFSKSNPKDTVNVISYCLKNNSNQKYLINNLIEDKSLIKYAIYKNGLNVHVFNSRNEELKYEVKRFSNNYPNGLTNLTDCYKYMIDSYIDNEKKLNNNINLKYFGLNKRNNIFFLHPGEIIYFQYSLCLTNFQKFDEVRQGFVNLDLNKNYYSKLTIASDSTNYKNVLSKDILKTIEANNVKVYHGIIESKNSVPIKVLE